MALYGAVGNGIYVSLAAQSKLEWGALMLVVEIYKAAVPNQGETVKFYHQVVSSDISGKHIVLKCAASSIYNN